MKINLNKEQATKKEEEKDSHFIRDCEIFGLFSKYLASQYEKNIINYKVLSLKERTNNALESYHNLLQSKLTKYYFFFLYLIFLLDTTLNDLVLVLKERSMSGQNPLLLLNPSTYKSIIFYSLGYSPKNKKNNLNKEEKTSSNSRIKTPNFQKGKTDDERQCLIWKSNSCRLDAFFTVFMFSVVTSKHFILELLSSRDNRKLKDTLKTMIESCELAPIQKGVYDFAQSVYTINWNICICIHYQGRQKLQTWSQKYKKSQLRTNYFFNKRYLSDSKGDITSAMILKFKKYTVNCQQCEKLIQVARNIMEYPKFILILFELRDEFNDLESQKNFELFPSIKLSFSVKLNRSNFIISSVCYFQNNHYTAHIRSLNHKIIAGLNSDQCNFHDDASNNGIFIQSDPDKVFNIKTEKNIPYILLYTKEQ